MLLAGVATVTSAATPAKVQEAVDIATDAYIYGYSLVVITSYSIHYTKLYDPLAGL